MRKIKFLLTVFKKLVGDVRSIDESQVPTDLYLMGILKKAMIKEDVLWGNLEFNSEGMSLDKMMNIISKWKPKDGKNSETTANYVNLPGNLKKAHARSKTQAAAVERTRSIELWLKLVPV